MRLIAAVACALAVTVPALSAPPGIAERVPEVPAASFKALCDGHVTGAPDANGKPGPHIEWWAYSSPSTVAELAKRLAAKLTVATHETSERCELWRFADRAHHVWTLCAVEEKGPASECAPPPVGTKSVLVVSTMVGED